MKMVKKAEIEEISYKLGQITSNIENLNEKFVSATPHHSWVGGCHGEIL